MDGPLQVPDLRDRHVRLRPMGEQDVPEVARICQDERIQHWTRVPAPYGEAEARDFLRMSSEALADGRGAHLLAVGSDEEVLGAVGIDLDAHDRAGTVGYWVAPAARGRGIATRAARLLVRWAFRDLGVERCTLYAAVPNVASNEVARRVGFVHEGVMRAAFLVGPAHARYRVDANVWGMLPDDLPPAEHDDG